MRLRELYDFENNVVDSETCPVRSVSVTKVVDSQSTLSTRCEEARFSKLMISTRTTFFRLEFLTLKSQFLPRESCSTEHRGSKAHLRANSASTRELKIGRQAKETQNRSAEFVCFPPFHAQSRKLVGISLRRRAESIRTAGSANTQRERIESSLRF